MIAARVRTSSPAAREAQREAERLAKLAALAPRRWTPAPAPQSAETPS